MKLRPVTLRIPEDLYRRIKAFVKKDDLKMKAVGARAFELWILERENKPSETADGRG